MENSKFRQRYIDYINSPAWRKKRKQALNAHGSVCSECGSTARLHVHHLNYKTLFKEDISSLMILCESCHMALHNNQKAQPQKHKKVKKKQPDRRKMAQNGVKTKRWLKDNEDKINEIYAVGGEIRLRLVDEFGKTKTKKIIKSRKTKAASKRKKAR